jgi:predicted RNase H-like HicB family nuclease
MARKQFAIKIKTIYGTFPCTFERERDMGGYTAEATNVPGAVSWGKTLAAAKLSVKEAIEGAIETRALVEVAREGSVRITRIPSRRLVTA